ncbi:hypothetical protein DSECCO2_573990 [anaerobic digester metagenome]
MDCFQVLNEEMFPLVSLEVFFHTGVEFKLQFQFFQDGLLLAHIEGAHTQAFGISVLMVMVKYLFDNCLGFGPVGGCFSPVIYSLWEVY